MGVRIGYGLAVGGEAREAAVSASFEARAQLDGAPADLVVLFASGDHLTEPSVTLEGVHEAMAPGALVGCGAGGVVGGRREIESGTAVAVWAASLDGGTASTFHAGVEEVDEGVLTVDGVPDLTGAAGAIMLPDPWTFPVDLVLAELALHSPGVPILGGVASGEDPSGGAVLFHGDEVLHSGAVGVRFDGVEMLPCVSQGATPVGPELTVTAADGHVIGELAGKPAIQTLREVIYDLPAAEREMISHGLLLGIVVDGDKPDYLQGDFLVRGLIGADPEEGSIAVGAEVRPGQVVRLHARDAESATSDLRSQLELRRLALGGAEPAGALVFTCNGRGRGMFGVPDHDAETIGDELADAPAAGFFAGGEIGPVGGGSFLHSFTATLAVFPR